MKRITVAFLALLFTCSFQVPPTATVPDDYETLQAALDALPSGGVVVLRAGEYSGNRSYGYQRSASIVIDGNRDITIQGEPGAVITYDPVTPPDYYGEVGPVVIISNTGQTTIDGLHFIGTRALGDPLYDLDVCIYSIADAPFTVRNSEIEQCGHAGIKHGVNHSQVIIEGNRFHDNGFTSRDHHVYVPGGAEYIIRDNYGWNATGGCVGFGWSYWTIGGVIENNVCVNNGYGIWSGWGVGETITGNFAMNNQYYDLGIYGGGHIFTDNIFGHVDSERSCGGIVTNWCTDPVPNVFYDNGNLYETINYLDRIE